MKEEFNLVSTRYKYNRKKALVFVCSEGAGIIATGESYLAKFQDFFGNVCIYQVVWPAVISRYFDYSHQVDVHN